jgi:hypothetical protein
MSRQSTREESRQWTISRLMGLVLAVAIILAVIHRPSMSYSELVWLIALYIGYRAYLQWVLPVLVVRKTKITADRQYIPLGPDDGQTPEPVRASIRVLKPKVEALGFRTVGNYSSRDERLNSIVYLTLFENRETSQTARLFTLDVLSPRSPRRETTLLFHTEFADGTRLATGNSASGTLTPRVRVRKGTAAFPQCRDPEKLYEIHQAALARFAGDALRRPPSMTEPLEYLRSFAYEQTLKQVETGYYYLDEESGVFHHTWKGAAMKALRLGWPGKQVYNFLRRRRAERLLKEMGIEIDSSRGE